MEWDTCCWFWVSEHAEGQQFNLVNGMAPSTSTNIDNLNIGTDTDIIMVPYSV